MLIRYTIYLRLEGSHDIANQSYTRFDMFDLILLSVPGMRMAHIHTYIVSCFTDTEDLFHWSSTTWVILIESNVIVWLGYLTTAYIVKCEQYRMNIDITEVRSMCFERVLRKKGLCPMAKIIASSETDIHNYLA